MTGSPNRQTPAEIGQTDTAPWTIKSMPVAVRQRATQCAQAQDQTVAAWMAEAVTAHADRQANHMVLPPGKPAADFGKPDAAHNEVDLHGLASALASHTNLCLAAQHPPSVALIRNVSALLIEQTRRARGLPARQTSPRNGQTIKLALENQGQPPAPEPASED